MESYVRWLIVIIFVFMTTCGSCYYSEHYIDDSCKFENETVVYETLKSGFIGTFKATSRPPYEQNKHCKIIIKPPADQGIVLSVRNVDLRSGIGSKTCEDYIKVYHSDALESPTILCSFKYDLQETLSFFSKGPMIFVYHTEIKANENEKYNVETGFTFTYTSVSLDIQDCKQDNIFMCNNGRCISEGATCDSRNNCGDRSDESTTLCDNDFTFFSKITDDVYFTIFSILSLIVVSGFCFTQYKGQKADPQLLYNNNEPIMTYQVIHPNEFLISNSPSIPNIKVSSDSKEIQPEKCISNP